MNMHQQPPPVDRIQESKNFLSWVHFIARALAMSVELFLHRGGSFGQRYLGPQGLVAAAIMFVFPVFWPQSDPMPLMWMLITYLALWMLAKGRIAARRAKGDTEVHSYYTGRPRLMRSTGGRGEIRIKRTLEPALVMVTGMVVLGVNEPLGAYLLLAGVGLGISVNASLQQERMRALDMQDALMEQRWITELWRRGR
jgi:hypothetical protein